MEVFIGHTESSDNLRAHGVMLEIFHPLYEPHVYRVFLKYLRHVRQVLVSFCLQCGSHCLVYIQPLPEAIYPVFHNTLSHFRVIYLSVFSGSIRDYAVWRGVSAA